jgi:hypothetical protein
MTTLEAADRVYATGVDANFIWHPVRDRALTAFARAFRQLRSQLGDDVRDPYWERPLEVLRIALHVLSSTPLPADHPALGLDELTDRYLTQIQRVEAISPGAAPRARQLGDLLVEIMIAAHDPLGEMVAELLAASPPKDCLLLRRPRRLEAVRQRYAAGGHRLLVATPQVLSGSEVFDRIIAIGPSYWFGSLITAPRAKTIDIVHLSVTRDSPSSRGILPGSQSRGSMVRRQPVPSEESTPADESLESDAYFAEPSIAWDRIVTASQPAVGEPRSELDTTDARLILLADGTAAFISVTEGAKNWVVDPTQKGRDRIRVDPWDTVGPGTFVILRMEGAGGVGDIADRILGPRAARLREHQRGWKLRLREAVSSSSPAEVVRRLIQHGSARASLENLRNWQSLDHIRTRDYRDFLAIMRLVGLEADAPALWEEMGTIMRAHTEAGMRLREALIRRLANADLTPLMTEGRMEVREPQLGLGTLAVVRVEEVSPETYPVSRSRLDHAFDPEDGSWLG